MMMEDEEDQGTDVPTESGPESDGMEFDDAELRKVSRRRVSLRFADMLTCLGDNRSDEIGLTEVGGSASGMKSPVTCPVHGEKCADNLNCSPNDYIEDLHRFSWMGVVTSIPFRIRYFCNRKLTVFQTWLAPPDLYDPNIRSRELQWPFLKLKVTFDPSRELAILYYFQMLSAQKRLGMEVEFDRIEHLLEQGADINARDETGKTVLHAACREEGLPVVQYLIEKGGIINTTDEHGRTPLHMAAAMENHTLIEYLVSNKADYGATTHGDGQTPLHYAAKNDAPLACRALIEHGATVEVKDYRGRTPLLLAAELDRSVAASALLDCGASAKVLDYTGYHPVCAMIKNMPDVAIRGLNQFYRFNKTSRQEIYWLNCLEPSLISGQEFKFPSPSVLEEVVKTRNQTLINHPVVKEMIKTKWSQFGIFGSIYELVMYLITLLVWSLLVLVRTYWNSAVYHDRNAFHFSDGIAVVAVILFCVQAGEEVLETWEGYKAHRDWRSWRMQQIQGDLRFVLPENVEEKLYLEDMEQEVRKTKSPYWSDFWNVYDWCFLLLLLCTYLMYWIDRHSKPGAHGRLPTWKSMFLTITLIAAWIKLFKYLKVFETMGPFVVIISNTFGDVLKIAFVYFILYIPASCVFYQFFGASHIQEYQESIVSVFFTVFRMIVVDDYYYEDLIVWGVKAGIPESWIQFLVSYWLLASAIVLLNLFIALMSDTFQRIYDKACEVAALERAETIVALEKKLSVYKRDQFLEYIKKNFAPKIKYIEKEELVSVDDARKQGSSRSLTAAMLDQVRELDHVTTEGPEDGDEGLEVRGILEEQEAHLRAALFRLDDAHG